MTFGWPANIVSAFEKARKSEAPLGERLRIVADLVSSEYPDFTQIADAFVGRLERAKAGARAPSVGEPLPDFLLPDQDGTLVGLQGLLERGPIVVAFHRGHWCPYCHLGVAALAEIEQRTGRAQIVAISPETQQYTRHLKAETGAGFPFLTDLDAAYAMSLNLAVWIDPKFSSAIARIGCDVPLYNRTQSWILPIPAVFVVRPDGIIAARHIDPDYRRRMEVDELLRCVQKVL